MASKEKSAKLRREKEFKIRNSPLTDRFEQNEDIKTIYNLFAIILISLLINTVIYDYLKTGELHFGFRLILLGFNNIHLVVLTWCCMNLLAYLAYFAFNLWARVRTKMQPQSTRIWDKIWFGLLIIYFLFFLYGIRKTVIIFNLEACSRAVLLMDGVRLLMKQYAFIRSNASLALSYKPHSDQTLDLPPFKNFLYFTFIPTLIYRNDYPRTNYIKWKFVIYNLAEVLGLIYLLSLVVERFLVPPFENICLKKYTMSDIVVPVVANSFPGIMFMLCAFYSVLHSFQNAFAEMTRFGDRMFYREWWTSRSLSDYYRTWNVIVHDWLYIYIYRDMYEIVIPKNKLMAKLMVFVVSAVTHEWIITTVLDLFLPVQFLQFFTASVVLSLLNSLDLPVGNLLVWYLIVFGSGMQVNLYTLEFFARKNCPMPMNTTLDFFKARFITCDCITD